MVSNDGRYELELEKTDRIIPGGKEVDHYWQTLINDYYKHIMRYDDFSRTTLDVDRILDLPGAVMKNTESEYEVILFDKDNKQFYLLTHTRGK